MKPPVEIVKVSSKGRDILIRAKSRTGLSQWNELLRWAYCSSIADPNPITRKSLVDSAVEVEWNTFSGSYSEVFRALFVNKFEAERPSMDPDEYFRLLIERGVRELHQTPDLSNLAQRAGETKSSN